MKVRNVLMLVLALVAGSSMLFAGAKGETPSAAPAADVKPIVLRLAETHPADYPTATSGLPNWSRSAPTDALPSKSIPAPSWGRNGPSSSRYSLAPSILPG